MRHKYDQKCSNIWSQICKFFYVSDTLIDFFSSLKDTLAFEKAAEIYASTVPIRVSFFVLTELTPDWTTELKTYQGYLQGYFRHVIENNTVRLLYSATKHQK